MGDSAPAWGQILAAGILAMACSKEKSGELGKSPSPTVVDGSAEKACCMGKNECRGKGGCAVPESNSCAGKNECRGKGGCNMHCPKEEAAPKK
jgi:hypothetical protein